MKFYRILILTFLAYTLISCGGAEERKSVYMEKAKASIEAGNIGKARIELKNVLQIDPKHGEAYYLLGGIYEQQKEFRKAYANYLKAEELSPELLSNHARLGRFYLLLMNDTEKAEEKIDFVLSKEPNNVDGLLLKAAVALRKGKLKEVITMVEVIVSDNPKHAEAIAFLSVLYIKDENIADAIDTLDTGIKNNQSNEELNRLLVRALVGNKEYKRAEGLYINFLKDNPDNATSYNNLAAFYIKSEDQAKAEETLRASVANKPNDAARILTLIKYIRGAKGDAEAIEEMEAFIISNNGIGELRLALGELLAVSGDKQAAIDTFKQAVADFSEEEAGIKSRLALAAIYISDKNIGKAEGMIEEAIVISPNDPHINMLRAKLAVHDKDMEKAIISLRIVTKETPEDIEAFVMLADVYQQQGNAEQANAIMLKAYGNNKMNVGALLKLAQYYYSRDIQQAEKIIDDYIKIKPSDYDGLSMKAAILNQSKKQDKAKKIADILMETYPEKSNGYLRAMPYYAQKGDKKKAASVLEKGYLNVKDNRKLLALLTALQVADKKFDVVEKRINAELTEEPNDTSLKVLLAKVRVANKNTESAIKLLNEVVEANPLIEEPYLLLSQLYQNKKDKNAFKNILAKGKKNVASSINISLRLAGIYELEGKYQEAIKVYRDFHEISSGNFLVMNNLASLLSDHGDAKDLEFAKTLIPKLEKAKKTVFLDTVGWVYYKLGDTEKAVNYLTQVTEKMPDVNVFNYHLGMSYLLSGDKKQAKIFLEKSLVNEKSFKEKSAAEEALKNL